MCQEFSHVSCILHYVALSNSIRVYRFPRLAANWETLRLGHDLLGPGHDLATTPRAINTLTINKRARKDAISDTYCLLTPRLHDLLGLRSRLGHDSLGHKHFDNW